MASAEALKTEESIFCFPQKTIIQGMPREISIVIILTQKGKALIISRVSSILKLFVIIPYEELSANTHISDASAAAANAVAKIFFATALEKCHASKGIKSVKAMLCAKVLARKPQGS
jgi:hypothetical protein